MGLCLIAAEWTDPSLWIAVLKGAIALGLVIFVHELGHFAVAKLCGVKCEKFYLGFDIAGLKFCRVRWGETEYGIGILPVGGYVKMLGQEDNPARLREEIERAKQKRPEGKAGEGPPGGQPDVAAAEQALFDPRSYLAKSVPKRMAIISAGVVMNLIFALVAAAIAFGLGVERVQCVVGQTEPGKAAWQEGIRVGDRVVEIAGRKIEKFDDMRQAVSLGDDIEKGIPILVRRPGVEDLLTFTLIPDSSGQVPRIGIVSSSTTTFWPKEPAAIPGSAAARCIPKLAAGDKIVEIDGRPIETYAQIHTALALHPEQPLEVTIERPAPTTDPAREPRSERKTVKVPPNPMRRLGLVMELGAISGVQKGSPAAAAGIRPGDVILKIDGQPPGDPMTLPDRLRRRAGQTITLSLQREGIEEPIDIEVGLRPADWYEQPGGDLVPPDLPVSVPSLGIAYVVLNRVASVMEGFPAAEAGLEPGDVIVAATVVPPEEQTPEQRKLEYTEAELEFGKGNRNWASLTYLLQRSLPGTQVKLEWTRQKEEMSATLQPQECSEWFNPDRGFRLDRLTFPEKAETLGEAVSLGARETLHATLVVYRVLQKLGTQQVSFKALGGPISIFVLLKQAAQQSTPELLITLTILSANLAVLNFLPIPVLDGGHMVFLAWEGIRGKPADERVQFVLTCIGLALILSLMIWVIALDIGRWFSGFF